MNWTTLSITITEDSRPIQGLVVTFVILNSDKTISFSITAITDSNGVATVSNSSTNSYIKYDSLMKNRSVSNDSDFDFDNLVSWYASFESNGVITNTSSINLVNGSNTTQSTPRSTNYNQYKILRVSTTNGTIVKCFFYNSSGELMDRIDANVPSSVNYSLVDLSGIENYTDIKYIKFNAYRSYGNDACYVFISNVFNDIDNSPTNEITFTYDNDTIIANIPLTYHSLQFNVRIGRFGAIDYLAYYTGNICPIYSQTTLKIKSSTTDFDIWTGTTIWASVNVNSVFPMTGVYLTFEAYPQNYNSSVISYVHIFDYPYVSRQDCFVISEYFLICLKTEYQFRLPRILDTAKIRDTIQYPTPIYNLKDTIIVFRCPLKDGNEYIKNITSNDVDITFNSNEIGDSYEEIIKRLSLVEIPNSLSDVPTFSISKHHYINGKFYAIARSETYFIEQGYENFTESEYFFVDYQLSNNVPITAYTATSIYNLERYMNRDGANRNSMIRYVNWTDYEDSPILPLPYEMVYMTIKREKYVCPREKELDDYINGFSYNEQAGTDYYALRNFNLTAYTGFSNRKKLYVAKESFLESCGNKVGIPNLTEVPNYKKKFVLPFLNKGTRYGTDYTKNDLYDDYFLTNSDSGHAYVFDTKKYTFYPKTYYPYLRFEKLTVGETETVKLTKNGNPYNVSLLYSTAENLWFDYEIGTPIEIPDGGYVEFRNKYEVSQFSKNIVSFYHFDLSGGVDTKVLGNISSLLNPSALGITVTGASSHLFYSLFRSEYDLVDAEDLVLDINKVPESGYTCMFENCDNLLGGPEITAFSGSEHCFAYMFLQCKSLEKGPSKLFANENNERVIEYPSRCCLEMFSHCGMLKNGPSLEKSVTCRTYFGTSCFEGMFLECESMKCLGKENEDTFIGGSYYDSYIISALTTIDNSSILSEQSCLLMFAGCTSLKTSPIFNPCYVDKKSCYGMFSGCASLTKTYLNIRNYKTYEEEEVEDSPGYVGEEGCAYMYNNCTSLTELGRITLSATVLGNKAYFYMFAGCTNIGGFIGGAEGYHDEDDKKLPFIPATYIPPSGCAYMYYKCFGNSENGNFLNQFITEKLLEVDNFGMAHMFDSCEYLDTYPIERTLKYGTHTVHIKQSQSQCTNTYDAYLSIVNGEYILKMRRNNHNLNGVPDFISIAKYTQYNNTEISEDASYFDVLTENLTIEYNRYYIQLNATTIGSHCYAYMFTECNHLHYANHIILPKNILSPYCYDHMFYNCDELFAIPVLSAVTKINTCSMRSMFEECSSVAPNNNLGWWKTEHHWLYNDYTYYNHYNRIVKDSVEWEDERTYYVCRKGLYSIQKDYFYTFRINGRFSWPVKTIEYSGINGIYVKYTASGDTNNNGSVAWLLTHTSTGDAMESKTWEFGGDAGNVEFIGTSGMSNMFGNCYGLTYCYFKVISKSSTLPEYTFYSMFKNNFSLQKGFRVGFDAASNVNVLAKNHSFYAMFENCFEAKETFSENRSYSGLGHALRPNVLEKDAFGRMYHNCYKIKFAPRIIATGLSESCCKSMFDGCWRLLGMGTLNGTGVNNPSKIVLPASTLAKSCYNAMFKDCFSLRYAPGLPAQTLVTDCYSYMFNNAAKRYFNAHMLYKFTAEIREATPSNPLYVSYQDVIDGRQYWSIAQESDGSRKIRGKNVYVKCFGDEFFYFLDIQDESTEWISVSNILNISDDSLNVVLLDKSFFSKEEPISIHNHYSIRSWSFGNNELYFYDNDLPNTGYAVYDESDNVVGVYESSSQANEILSSFPEGYISAMTPYPIFFNNKKNLTFNFKPSDGFYGVYSNAKNSINNILGVGTRHLYSLNFITFFETNNYTFSGATDKYLYTTLSKSSNNDSINFYSKSSWQSIYNANCLGGADKFAIWVNDGETPPNGYVNFDGNSNIYVPKSMNRYEIRQQYEVTSGEFEKDVYEENIDLSDSSQHWDENKFFKTPTKIRCEDSVFVTEKMYDDFNIPLDNWFDINHEISLSSIVISAKTLNSTYSNNWVGGLKFADGDFYAKSGGNIPTGVHGCPENWDRHIS